MNFGPLSPHSPPSSSETFFFPTSLFLLRCLPVWPPEFEFLAWVWGRRHWRKWPFLPQQPWTSTRPSGRSGVSWTTPTHDQMLKTQPRHRSSADNYSSSLFRSGKLRMLLSILSLSFFLSFWGGDTDVPFRADHSTITYSWHLRQLWFFLLTVSPPTTIKVFVMKTKNSATLKI